MNDLCADIGYRSLNKYGEELCGDHVDVTQSDDGSTVVVLADGLGSGVKASILSTLTSKILSTMAAAGMRPEDCVETIAQTLPVCSLRGVAYSTFSILRILHNEEAELIQYDCPGAILLRDGKSVALPLEERIIAGKKTFFARLRLQENDIFILMSDGATCAGLGKTMNFGWSREDIITYMEPLSAAGYTAKTLSTILLNECSRLYGGEPGDDTTVCTVRVRRREPMNLLIGPPANPEDCHKMMSLFFVKEGKHIICGGTTSAIAAEYLRQDLVPSLESEDPEIPPMARIDGVDLVTEGIITMNKVVTYAKNYLEDNESYEQWCYKRDGASRIARLLFEEATDINFYVGKAVNPAHQNPDLPIGFNIKMRLVEELSDSLKKMGKKIKVSYF